MQMTPIGLTVGAGVKEPDHTGAVWTACQAHPEADARIISAGGHEHCDQNVIKSRS